MIRAMTLAMSYNLGKTTSQREGSRTLFSFFFSALGTFITELEDMFPECTKICDAFYILLCAYTFINFLRKLRLVYALLAHFYIIIKCVKVSSKGKVESLEFFKVFLSNIIYDIYLF